MQVSIINTQVHVYQHVSTWWNPPLHKLFSQQTLLLFKAVCNSPPPGLVLYAVRCSAYTLHKVELKLKYILLI